MTLMRHKTAAWASGLGLAASLATAGTAQAAAPAGPILQISPSLVTVSRAAPAVVSFTLTQCSGKYAHGTFLLRTGPDAVSDAITVSPASTAITCDSAVPVTITQNFAAGQVDVGFQVLTTSKKRSAVVASGHVTVNTTDSTSAP